jgi:NAD(P)-dependent dehydrogenase (short-subunit alcohol dehydrogenase family)
MDLGLKGKVAMVAGASRGLGFAVAQALAGEGAIVSIASRDEPDPGGGGASWFGSGARHALAFGREDPPLDPRD